MAKHRTTPLERDLVKLRKAGTDVANARLVRVDRVLERGRGPLLICVRERMAPQREDERIEAAALRRAAKFSPAFSRNVRGLRCSLCNSRNTRTEFYRIPPDVATFGVTACDDCGAC